MKVFLGVAGSMAAQGPIIFWVANHRLHHAFADTERDPHSPQPQGPGLSGRVKGLWHGHMGWLFTVGKTDWSRHTRDWLADYRVMRINPAYFWLVVVGILVPGLIGWRSPRRCTVSSAACCGVASPGSSCSTIRCGPSIRWATPSGSGSSTCVIRAATSARWRHPPWAGPGTTTTTPGPCWPRPAGTGGNSTWPASSSGCSTTRGWSSNVRYAQFGMTAEEAAAMSSRDQQTPRKPSRPNSDDDSRTSRAAKAIVQLDPRSARAKKVVALVTIGIPTIGLAVAVYLIVTGWATALDYTLFGGVLRHPHLRGHRRIPPLRRAQVVQDLSRSSKAC